VNEEMNKATKEDTLTFMFPRQQTSPSAFQAMASSPASQSPSSASGMANRFGKSFYSPVLGRNTLPLSNPPSQKTIFRSRKDQAG